MVDATSLQAAAAIGGFMLALISLIGGWTWWLIRDVERNLRREIEQNQENLRREMERNQENLRREMERNQENLRQQMERSQENLRQQMERSQENLRREMERNHRELLTRLAGHTHGDDGGPVFHILPDAGN